MAKKSDALRVIFVKVDHGDGLTEILAVMPDVAVGNKLSCFGAAGWNTISEIDMLALPQVQLTKDYQSRLNLLQGALEPGIEVEVIIPDRRKAVLAEAREKRKAQVSRV